MRSSISVTKILTFCFILLILILKAKLCVSFVSISSGVSDDSLQSASFVEEPKPNVSLDAPGFVNYSAKHHLHKHASTMPSAHRVRHKHHHMKIRHNAAAAAEEDRRTRRGYKSNTRIVNPRLDKPRHNVHLRPRHGNRHHRVNAHHAHHHHHRGGGGRKIHTHSSHGNSWHLVASGNSSFLMQQQPVAAGGDEQKTARAERIFSKPVTSTSKKGDRITSPARSHVKTTLTPAKQSALPISNRTSTVKNNNNNGHRSSSYSRKYFEDLLRSYQGKQVVRSNAGDDEYAYDYDEGDNDDYDDDDDDDDEYDEEEDGDDAEDNDNEIDDDDDDETQGDAGYSMTTVNSEISGVSSHDKQTVRNTKSGGGQTQDNSFQRDGLDTTTPDKEPQLKSSEIQSSEGRKPQKQSPHNDMSRLASHHASKLRREGICSVPKPKLILASTDPSKQYTPHCTILHRCGDDVGCCLPTQTCASSKNTTIELYFFVHTVGSKSTIERLSFINHTECACINRLEPIQSTTSISPIPTVVTAPVCTCPSLFQRLIDNDNRCSCDCSSSDTQCNQFKHGLEHFSMENRRCIKDGRCQAPVCEHGHYNMAKGKCPTREDKLSYSYNG